MRTYLHDPRPERGRFPWSSHICSGAGQLDGSSNFIMGSESRDRSCVCSSSGDLAGDMDQWEKVVKNRRTGTRSSNYSAP